MNMNYKSKKCKKWIIIPPKKLLEYQLYGSTCEHCNKKLLPFFVHKEFGDYFCYNCESEGNVVFFCVICKNLGM